MSVRADRHGLPLVVVAICAASMAQVARPRQMNPAIQARLTGWQVDVNRDGAMDSCQLVIQSGFSGIRCTLAGTNRPFNSQNIDLGYPEGRAFVDFDGDGRPDYCRVIGNGYPKSYASCTFADDNGFGATVTSPSLDWGYAETRQWRDVNGDRKADFCRVVGNYRETLSCTFSQGRTFGRTVNSKR
ncbi:MAG TPA: hypothetical protein VFO19_12000 [Vicinamibacterales bacterium]|nr:hypothetical protein [Vicinamibacterales bacterium]